LVSPARRRQVWVALVPLAIYGAWLIWLRAVYFPAHPGSVQHIVLSNLLVIPNMIAQQGAATAGALAGLNYDFSPTDIFGGVFSTSSAFGGVLAVVAAAGLVLCLRRRATPMLWTLVALLLAYCAELALGSGVGRTPTTIRYTYAAATIWMLIAAEAWRQPINSRPRLIILYGLVAVALLGNLARLRDGIDFFRPFAIAERAQLAAIEIASPSVSPNYETHLGLPPFVPVTAGPYLAAVARDGSPAFSAHELAFQPVTVRRDADAVLVSALGIAPAATTLSPGSRCLTSARGARELTVRTPGLRLRSSNAAQVFMAQYSDGVQVGSVAAGGTVALRIPGDRSSRPWRIELRPAPARISICPLG
jgi:hypothetical protein